MDFSKFTYDFSGFLLWWTELIHGNPLSSQEQGNIEHSFHEANKQFKTIKK